MYSREIKGPEFQMRNGNIKGCEFTPERLGKGCQTGYNERFGGVERR